MDAAELLSKVAEEVESLDCLCDLKREMDVAQLILRSRHRQKTVEAALCERVDGRWVTVREAVSTVPEGLQALSAKYRGTLLLETFRVFEKASPLRGEEMKSVFTAALKVRAACCAACGIWFLAAEGEPVLCLRTEARTG